MSSKVIKAFCALAAVLLLAFKTSSFAAEAPSLYGIHDHYPDPGEFLTKIENGGTRGWVTATVAVGANTNDFSGASFTHISNRGHTVICRINYGYFPDGTIPVASKWDDFATRCANFVQNSTGCDIWLIANESNLPAEWPLDPSNNRFNYVSPQDYATLYRKVYNAIKSVRPNDKVLPQAIAQWAGPLGSGEFWVNGTTYPHDGLPLNWVTYLNQMLTAIAASGPLDGISLHIGSRGYAYSDIHSTARDGVNNLYWSFYAYKDWVNLGIPASLYHLPLYATECNGMFYWKGGHPEDGSKHYEPGWMQEMYAEVNRYNQYAALSGRPVFRCVNLYRWCAGCDGWNIDADGSNPNPYKTQIMTDLESAIAQRYLSPTNVTKTNFALGYAINAGGGAISSFGADQQVFGSTNTFSTLTNIDLVNTTNAAPEAVYQSERWGQFTYLLGGLAPSNNYTVRLHFAEISPSVTGSGQRQFHVVINGAQVLTNFDIYANAGGKHKAITRDFSAVASSYGQVEVQFVKGASNEPKLNGIEIIESEPFTLASIGNRTITEGSSLTLEVTPNEQITDFESYFVGGSSVMFRPPAFSSSTSALIDSSPNVAVVAGTFPPGNNSTRTLNINWSYKTGASNPWLRLTTFSAGILPNPVVDFTKRLRFDIHTDRDLKVALGVRETGTSAPVGGNGGTTGPIEFVGVTGTSGGAPLPTRTVTASNWTTLVFDLPHEPAASFSSGNGALDSSTGKGVLEQLALVPAAGNGAYNIYLDNFVVVPNATFTFSLSNAPPGAAINPTNGVFTWTPTEAQGPGSYSITVRAIKNGVATLSALRSFVVTVMESNQAPTLAPIADRTVNAGTQVIFTNVATDFDIPTNVLTFALDAAPAGASIDANSGLFSWITPNVSSTFTNAVVVRVTDNGSPPFFDTKSFNVVVIAPPQISQGFVEGGNFVVSFQSFPGKTYQVQFKDDLNQPSWTNLETGITANSSSISVTNSLSGFGNRFYRIVQVE